MFCEESDEESDAVFDEETYEDSYESNDEESDDTIEVDEDATPWESEEDTLDWSVPAGVSEQETIVIDSVETDTEEADTIEESEYEEQDDPSYELQDFDSYAEDDGYAVDEQTYYEQPAEEVIEESVEYVEEPAVQIPQINPEIALVDVLLLDAQFEDGDVIDLQALKDKGLVLDAAKTLKIYKSGPNDLTKSFTVVADHLTVDAIFAIHRANGRIEKINKFN